jgi:hypothetical protein
MKNTSNHMHGISVNGMVPINAILDGAEFLISGRDPGAYRITIEHVSKVVRPASAGREIRQVEDRRDRGAEGPGQPANGSREWSAARGG